MKKITICPDTSGSLSEEQLRECLRELQELPPSLQITCTGGSKVSNIRVGKGTHVILVTDGYRAPWYRWLFAWVKALFN